MRTLLFPLALGLLLASCSTGRHAGIASKPLFKGKDGKLETTLFWSHFDATQRASLVHMDKDGKMSVLAENPPDAAVERSLNFLANVKGLDQVDAEVKVEAVKTIAQLGQRTAAVNILRDALYRLAEMCNNADGMNSTMNADVKAVMLATLATCEKVSIELAKETDATAKAQMLSDLKELYLSLPEAERSGSRLEMMLQNQ